MFTISAKLLHQVSAFRAEDSEVRYYLSGVHLERDNAGRVILVATDEHRLIAAQDASALWAFQGGDTFIIDFKTPGFKQALTRAAKSDLSRVQWDGLALEVLEHPKAGADGALVSTYQVPSGHAAMIDAKFPDWRSVIPRKELVLGHIGRINGELLQGLERFSGRYGFPMDIYTTGDAEDAAVIRMPGAPHMVAIIMPMRRRGEKDEGPMVALPEFSTGQCWQTQAPAAKPAAAETEKPEALPPVQATATERVAEWIDPKGTLRAAGLLHVVPVTA